MELLNRPPFECVQTSKANKQVPPHDRQLEKVGEIEFSTCENMIAK